MKRLKFFFIKAIIFNSLFLIFSSCKNNQNYENRESFSEIEENYIHNLDQIIIALDQLATVKTINETKESFLNAKKYFKYAEPILAFVDESNYKAINQPNIVKVNEEDKTNIQINQPFGFQVLDELIFASKPDVAQIKKETEILKNRVRLIKENTSLKHFKQHHILWIIRDAINRVALKGITGFDTTASLMGLTDSEHVYESLLDMLILFEPAFKNKSLYDDWRTELNKGKDLLKEDFNNFDRYNFIKNHTHKTLILWSKTVKDWDVKFEIKQALNYQITSLFDKKTFNINYFTDQEEPLATDKVNLGKELFNDKKLSDSKQMSCASCHNPTLAFTDGRVKPQSGKRNSPTLLYAGLQKGFFYDNRSGGLEGQIIEVIKNPTEFHSTEKNIVAYVSGNKKYNQTIQKIYKQKPTDYLVRSAIASYILSLNPFNSKFDRNISNLENTLTKNEINGFNLFMGKAKCATCHFAPLFNGTVPNSYRESEIELIGVPSTNDKKNPKIDSDLGRYEVFKTENRKFFFKTPTLRNISKTAPYMHNGVFKNLEEVVEFYNNGGGNGLGLKLEFQTLPFDALHLSEKEMQQLIDFMNTLTDK